MVMLSEAACGPCMQVEEKEWVWNEEKGFLVAMGGKAADSSGGLFSKNTIEWEMRGCKRRSRG